MQIGEGKVLVIAGTVRDAVGVDIDWRGVAIVEAPEVFLTLDLAAIAPRLKAEPIAPPCNRRERRTAKFFGRIVNGSFVGEQV